MKKKFTCILLVDDDEANNFINEKIIQLTDCAEKIVVTENGQEALEYIRSASSGESPLPNMIFLDINMPIMNGWEFVEEYRQLDSGVRKNMLLNMLTTSFNPDDEQRAIEEPVIHAFYRKPLTVEIIGELAGESKTV